MRLLFFLWRQLTGEFVALDDNGRPHTVIEYTDFIYTGTLVDPNTRTPGLKSYKLTDGDHCNVSDDGTLQVLRTGIKLRRRP